MPDRVEVAPGLVLTGAGALHLPDAGLLALSDLHAGFGEATSGSWFVPPIDGLVGLESKLVGSLQGTSPDKVLVNGDFKHGFRPPSLPEAGEIRSAAGIIEEISSRLLIVEGNHDVGLKAVLRGASIVPRHEEGRFRFAHGHERVPRKRNGWLILGHEHPALDLRDGVGAGVRLPCFLVHPQERVVVMPAFSPWAAGVDPRRRGFISPSLQGMDPAEFEAYCVFEGDVLPFGRLGDLPRAIAV